MRPEGAGLLRPRPVLHAADPRVGGRRGDPGAGADRAGRAAILGYRRWLSHRWPGRCRFTPSCSTYGLAAVERYGLAVGGRLAAARVRRCKPGVPCGTADPLR
ncbi:membrane protein insertion efficiency factor YidD [Micromonospora siamensis]|uniref:membrane protein insertion efficiency factor YidD n=1 Tax=Micromonospora siamensis TaxID=299152 RepID=UPI001E622806|nr:membrane protein insertion efficiency factor YidD [Micromonospora siamensis]